MIHVKAALRPQILLPVLALAALIGVAAWVFVVAGAPPKSITLLTGPPGSAYAAFGERYRAILARSGIEVRLVPTFGDVDSLARIRDPASGASAAFLVAGLPGAAEAPGLESLGAVAYEPLWVFERAGGRGLAVEGLAGKRISVGRAGSGTREMVRQLFRIDEAARRSIAVEEVPPDVAADRLLRGDLDVVVLLDEWDGPAVQRLLASSQVALVGFPRADAHVALNANLNKLVLPAGIADLAANRPPSDVPLVAARSSLVVRGDLHEAIQFLLLDAASRIHGRPGVFHRAGTFPAAEALDHPLSDEAARFYKSGRPFLQRYLPFWAAVLGERLLLFLLPVMGLLVPLWRGLSGAYNAMLERRVLVLYGGLKAIELELEERGEAIDRGDVLRRLDELDRKASLLRVPLQLSQMRYTLKHHIRLVCDRLKA